MCNCLLTNELSKELWPTYTRGVLFSHKDKGIPYSKMHTSGLAILSNLKYTKTDIIHSHPHGDVKMVVRKCNGICQRPGIMFLNNEKEVIRSSVL